MIATGMPSSVSVRGGATGVAAPAAGTRHPSALCSSVGLTDIGTRRGAESYDAARRRPAPAWSGGGGDGRAARALYPHGLRVLAILAQRADHRDDERGEQRDDGGQPHRHEHVLGDERRLVIGGVEELPAP